MKKSIIVFLHIGFWVCYLLIITIMVGVFYRSSDQSVAQTNHVINAFYCVLLFSFFPSFLTFYAYYLWVFPKFLKQKKVLLSIVWSLLISLVSAIIGYCVIRYFIESGMITDMDNGGKNGRSTAVSVTIVMAFIATISGIVGLVIKGFITWLEEIKLKEELHQKTHETEMALVKAQLDPHFLFNTLNNIDVLMLKDVHEASNYLNKLSDILRFMLYETKADEILLETEIEYIAKYIELQKIRTSNANYVSFEVTGSPGNKTIAPMVFIPFIENAFKHTTNKKTDNAITVRITIKKDTVEFVCENKFDPHRKLTGESNGLGNELIQKRLHLMYPEKHTLTKQHQSEVYSVHLTIQNG